jgi:hypothetical protein
MEEVRQRNAANAEPESGESVSSDDDDEPGDVKKSGAGGAASEDDVSSEVNAKEREKDFCLFMNILKRSLHRQTARRARRTSSRQPNRWPPRSLRNCPSPNQVSLFVCLFVCALFFPCFSRRFVGKSRVCSFSASRRRRWRRRPVCSRRHPGCGRTGCGVFRAEKQRRQMGWRARH